jgi:AbrB family looped-hinge helix DNA binding protein
LHRVRIIAMKEVVSTISSKGQVTIPAEIRRKLQLGPKDEVAFVVTDEGTVELGRPRFTLESVFGSISGLPNKSPDLEREIDEATASEYTSRMLRK